MVACHPPASVDAEWRVPVAATEPLANALCTRTHPQVFNVSFSCGANQPVRSLVLGPDKGQAAGDGAGVSFTEAGGRVMHVDCKPRAAELHFVTADVNTYQGRVASSWRVFPRTRRAGAASAASSLCGSVDANTYGGAAASLNLSCAAGRIAAVAFASYGEPSGTCGNFSLDARCHHANSRSVVAELCVGKRSCVIDATQVTGSAASPWT